MYEILLLIIVCLLAITYWFLQKTASPYTGGAQRNKPIYYSAPDTSNFIAKAPNIDKILDNAETILYYDQIPQRMPYNSTRSVIKTTLHNGQLKLFLTELEFLTDYADGPTTCVYAGSAPSNKINFLAQMFPLVRFILIDPHEHYIMFPHNEDQYTADNISKCVYFRAMQTPQFAPKSAKVQMWKDGAIGIVDRTECVADFPDNIAEIIDKTAVQFYIYEDFYTNKVSETLAKLPGRVLFVSDIRSQFESTESPRNIDILWNCAMMYNWLEILKPAAFMLKFRCPYAITDADITQLRADYASATYTHDDFERCKIKFMDDFAAKKFNYIKPDKVYMQAFAGPTSTESRLVGTSLEIAEWDCDEYNDRFFYYNRIHRPYGWHTSHEQYVDPQIGIDRCGDCAIMCKIFDNYFAKFGKQNETKKYIRTLLKHIHRTLFDINFLHGIYYKKETKESVIKSPMADNESNAVITLFKDIPQRFTPMSTANAYRTYKFFMEHNRAPFTIEFALFGYYKMEDPALVNYLSNTEYFINMGGKYGDFVKQYEAITVPEFTINYDSTKKTITAGELTIPVPEDIKGMTPERLFTSVAGNPSIIDYKWLDVVDEKFSQYIIRQAHKKNLTSITMITGSAIQTVNIYDNPLPIKYYNTLEDNIVKLDLADRDTLYVINSSRMPRVLQQWLSGKMRGRVHGLILFPGTTVSPHRYYSSIVYVDLAVKMYNGEKKTLKFKQVAQNIDFYEN